MAKPKPKPLDEEFYQKAYFMKPLQEPKRFDEEYWNEASLIIGGLIVAACAFVLFVFLVGLGALPI